MSLRHGRESSVADGVRQARAFRSDVGMVVEDGGTRSLVEHASAMSPSEHCAQVATCTA